MIRRAKKKKRKKRKRRKKKHQIAEKYMDTVFRVAYGWLKNPDDANDVTQDVLVELYKTDKAFESDAHLKNWLIRVTVNRCKMIFRSPWRRHEDIDDYAETLSFEQPRYFLSSAITASNSSPSRGCSKESVSA